MKFSLSIVRAMALTCVAATSIYIMYMGYALTQILASPDWCGKALQAEKISSQNFGGLTACTDLLKIQLQALARASLVYAGVIALCLLVLVVIVLADGHVAFKANKDGIDTDIGKSPAAAAAAETASAAVNKATEIASEEPRP